MNAKPRSWLQAMTECLERVDAERSAGSSALVDHDIVIDPRTEPEDIRVWCICRTRDDKHRFTDNELTRFASALRREMLQRGFPETALASLRIEVTSREERDVHGGQAGLS